MLHTFNQYYLKNQLSHKPGRDTYLAYSGQQPEHLLVLKIFDAECIVPGVTLADFREMEMRLRLVEHPHCVPVLAVALEQGKPYMVREYRQEGSLRQYLDLRFSGHLTLEETVGVVTQIGAVVMQAHAQQLVHQDIRPENILLNAQGAVLLADFSLQRLIRLPDQEEGREPDSRISYRAPEQGQGEVSPLSDQYALACVFYELLTGTLPDAASLCEHETLTPSINASLPVSMQPARIEAVLLRALERDMQKRYPDVKTFLRELKSVAQPEPSAFLFPHLASGYQPKVTEGTSEEELSLALEPPLPFFGQTYSKERFAFAEGGASQKQNAPSLPDGSLISNGGKERVFPSLDKESKDKNFSTVDMEAFSKSESRSFSQFRDLTQTAENRILSEIDAALLSRLPLSSAPPSLQSTSTDATLGAVAPQDAQGNSASRPALEKNAPLAADASQPLPGPAWMRAGNAFTLPALPDWKRSGVLLGLALLLTLGATLFASSVNANVMAAVKTASSVVGVTASPTAMPTSRPTPRPRPTPTPGPESTVTSPIAPVPTIAPVGNAALLPGMCYQAYVQNIGWQGQVCNGQQAGTTGQSLRMEAIRIWIVHPINQIGVCYQAYVQNIGWQGQVCNGQQAGTTGQSLRMEAIRIWIVHPINQIGVCYQAYVQNIDWQGQVCNGQQAGTTGQSLRMEAIRILRV